MNGSQKRVMHVTPLSVAQLTRIWNKDGDAPVIFLRCFCIMASVLWCSISHRRWPIFVAISTPRDIGTMNLRFMTGVCGKDLWEKIGILFALRASTTSAYQKLLV